MLKAAAKRRDERYRKLSEKGVWPSCVGAPLRGRGRAPRAAGEPRGQVLAKRRRAVPRPGRRGRALLSRRTPGVGGSPGAQAARKPFGSGDSPHGSLYRLEERELNSMEAHGTVGGR